MKVIYIECDADELKADRTILDSLVNTFSVITRTIGGFDVTPEMLAKACEDSKEDAESEDVK